MMIRLILCCGVLGATCVALPLRAQIRIISRAQLDSVARPTTVAGGDAMRFEQTRIIAATMSELDAPVSYRFVWSNGGAKPLVVTRVVTSCSCLTVDFDRRPILSGEQATVTATYHPKGHPGHFDRQILVYTQLADRAPSAVLSLTGEVTPSKSSAAGYSVTMGALELSRALVRFDEAKGEQEARIACRNAGEGLMRLRCDEQLLPRGFSFHAEPATLKSGAEGVLTIRFTPSEGYIHPVMGGVVFLKDLGLPPSRSSIRIVTEK